MKRWMTLAMGLTMALALCSGSAVGGFVDENGDGINDVSTFKHRFGKHGHGSLLSVAAGQLTDEQRTALREKINALIAEGATHTEIQNTIYAELEGFGIDATAIYVDKYSAALTAEQLATLQAKVDALKTDGATYMEIHTAIHEELATLGVDLKTASFLDKVSTVLTAEQLAAVQARVEALKAEGATSREIHSAIHTELTALGVDLRTASLFNRLEGVLTADQLAALQGKVDALVSEGASRAEIDQTVREELTTLGVDASVVGKGGHGGPGGRGHHKGGPRGHRR